MRPALGDPKIINHNRTTMHTEAYGQDRRLYGDGIQNHCRAARCQLRCGGGWVLQGTTNKPAPAGATKLANLRRPT